MRWNEFFVIAIILGLTAAQANAAEQPATRVAVAYVFEKEIAPTTLLVGSVVFDQNAGISSEISGLIDTHHMVEGTVVQKGDLLVRLNTDFILKDVQALQQQIAQLDLKIENTLKNLKRIETLYKEDASTEKSYDDLVFQVKELQVEKKRLLISQAKKRLELTKSSIHAPFNGLVLKRYKNQGEWVKPGDPICHLAAVDDVMVQVALSEELMPFIRVGQTLTLTITAMNKTLQGQVKVVVPRVDVKSKTFDVKIGISYTPGLFQNMSAQVNVPTGPNRKLKMIKRDALVRFQGKEFVYTVQNGKAQILPIQILAIDGEYLGVDMPHIVNKMPVVTDGNERLRPDQPVTVVNNPAKK